MDTMVKQIHPLVAQIIAYCDLHLLEETPACMLLCNDPWLLRDLRRGRKIRRRTKNRIEKLLAFSPAQIKAIKNRQKKKKISQ